MTTRSILQLIIGLRSNCCSLLFPTRLPKHPILLAQTKRCVFTSCRLLFRRGKANERTALLRRNPFSALFSEFLRHVEFRSQLPLALPLPAALAADVIA